MDSPILIPQHISKYGCYSSMYIMGASIMAGIYKYQITAVLAFLLSVTSYLNWKMVKKYSWNSWIKNIDIMVSCSIVLYVTLVDSARYQPNHRQLWFYTVFILVLVFVINELLLYYQVKNKVYVKNQSSPSNPNFSLMYTNPGTEEREYAYYRSTATHIMFIHLLPISVIMYCMYNAP